MIRKSVIFLVLFDIGDGALSFLLLINYPKELAYKLFNISDFVNEVSDMLSVIITASLIIIVAYHMT